MAYVIVGFPGAQAATDTSTVQKHPLGTLVKAFDSVKGEAELIYLQGVASTVIGSLVEINGDSTTTLASTASKGPVAVALSANVASQFGWYGVRGRISTVCAAGAANAAAYLGAAGVTNAVTALQGINGMKILAAPASGVSDCMLMYPSAAGYAAS